MDDLCELPLLLTKDMILRMFSSTQPIFVTNFDDLIDECADRFLYGKIKKMLIKIANLHTKKTSLCDLPVFIDFKLDSLAQMLPHEFARKDYYDQRSPIPYQYQSSEHLKRIWLFICKEVSNNTPVNIRQHTSMHRLLGMLREKSYERAQRGLKTKFEDKRNEIRSCIKPLEKWFLLPVEMSGKHWLYPIELVQEVLALDTVDNASSLSGILMQLSFSVPDKFLLQEFVTNPSKEPTSNF